MGDDAFLDFCLARAGSPACTLSPAQAGRLSRMVGDDVGARFWEGHTGHALDFHPDEIRELVATARQSLPRAA